MPNIIQYCKRGGEGGSGGKGEISNLPETSVYGCKSCTALCFRNLAMSGMIGKQCNSDHLRFSPVTLDSG